MNKLFFTLFLVVSLLLAGMTAAQAVETPWVLTFEWEQYGDLESLDKWVLHVREESGGPTVQEIDIFYVGGVGPTFSSTNGIVWAGDRGKDYTKYFVLVAHSKDGSHSDFSNEANYTLTIPWGPVETPAEFSVSVGVQVVPSQ